jgi:diacylglycerol kinase family enzyme
MPQRVLVIHSPHSGRSSKLPDAIKHLEQAGLEVVNSISIADLDHLPAQGTVWKERGVDVAIAAGGDGLVGGVVTLLLLEQRQWPVAVPIPQSRVVYRIHRELPRS